ncbi:MAG: biotin/lipoyl-binding protein [Beijerinckiaceae bacterium]
MSDLAERLAATIVPGLREDLRLQKGADDSGDGQFLIYDPMAHRYHAVDAQAFAMLHYWRGPLRLDALAAHLAEKTGTDIATEDLFELVTTLDQSGLLLEPMQGWKSVYANAQKQRKGAASWLLHNYLFIRVPLVRPDAFLQRTLPIARRLASPLVLAAIALAGLAGLYMVSRQWDAFSHTFLHFFSVEGAVGYLAALAFVKVFHELGHAYTARHFGCRVPTMGLAFMVLAPVLYTDVTDAWRLQSRCQKLWISAAGMMVEFAIAAMATLLWAFLPEGFFKSASFFVATVSWVMSLVINLSPLMRFDGYYLLSDYWRIPNLQARAFGVMRWWLREVLFGLGAECPEDWPRQRRIAVLIYAFAVCLYRLMLFIGIAVLVYYMTFKLLGILLFVVEILWFVLRPIFGEMRVWWMMRSKILQRKRYRFSLAATVAAGALVAVPWPHRVEVPAVLEPVAVQRIAMPFGAQIVQINVRSGDRVAPGDILFRFDAPKINADIASTQTRLDVTRLRYARRGADQTDRDATMVIEQDLAKLQEKMAGLNRLQEELIVRAHVHGVVRDVAPDLHGQRWLQRGDELAVIVAEAGHQVRGYVSESLLPAVQTGALGTFVADEPLMAKLPVRLASISAGGVAAIELAPLTSTHGGTIAVNEDKEKGALPVEAQYQAVMSVAGQQPVAMPVMRGIVLVDADPQSLLVRFFNRTLAVLIRESGF